MSVVILDWGTLTFFLVAKSFASIRTPGLSIKRIPPLHHLSTTTASSCSSVDVNMVFSPISLVSCHLIWNLWVWLSWRHFFRQLGFQKWGSGGLLRAVQEGYWLCEKRLFPSNNGWFHLRPANISISLFCFWSKWSLRTMYHDGMIRKKDSGSL